jgi:23S rRNA (cytosine1962-C5)-methyltransferase
MALDFNLICFEDEHLLVANKPPGLTTHSPSSFASEGLYDWLRDREPRWSPLAIIHRLDKETSGLLVFGKTSLANRALTKQFAERTVLKKYSLLTDRPLHSNASTVISTLVRTGEKYASRPLIVRGDRAETRFRVIASTEGRTVVEAVPVTGRTHQIRVHASSRGFPILGDTLYGGTAAKRLCLHAQELTFKHPATGAEMTFHSPADFEANPALLLRAAVVEREKTDAFRLVHGAGDGWPAWYVDRLGEFLLSQAASWPSAEQQRLLAQYRSQFSLAGVYHKMLSCRPRETSIEAASPKWLCGEIAPEQFHVRENGLRFELSFGEGYSSGLFLDQRDNRRRFLANYIARDFPLFESAGSQEVLNTFAYTCSFSVCAAKAGARVTSLDLSRKYLDWGKRNFLSNGLDPAQHDFIFGDVFDWLRRLRRKGRVFSAVILDPPTFSTSKSQGVFRVEKDYPRLVLSALPLLQRNGVLLAAANTAKIRGQGFVESIAAAIRSSGRTILQHHYFPQPPDFPISRAEPAHFNSVWFRIG